MRNFLLVVTALAGLICYDAAALAAGGKSSYSGGSKTSSSYSGGSSRSSTYSGGSSKSSSGYSGGSTKSSSGYSGGSRTPSHTYSGGSSKPSTYSGSTTHTPSHTPSYSGGSTKKSSSSSSPKHVESGNSSSGGWVFTIPIWDSKEKAHGSSGGSASPQRPPRQLTPEEIAAREQHAAEFVNAMLWLMAIVVVVVAAGFTLSWLSSRGS